MDNASDPFATVVTISFGDRLGDLLDTTAALRNLGLNIRRAKLSGAGGDNTFYITEAATSEKIVRSGRLEEIRMTILSCLMRYHPEATAELAFGDGSGAGAAIDGAGFDALHPLAGAGASKGGKAVRTRVSVEEDATGSHSILLVETTDRPGLLTSIVSVLKDVSVNVVSAEVDTEGRVARDEFFVTYHGEPLNPSMTTLVVNALQYYLSQAESAIDESY
jgi:UTP:GlnB (protein PII) uridylyltransferase